MLREHEIFLAQLNLTRWQAWESFTNFSRGLRKTRIPVTQVQYVCKERRYQSLHHLWKLWDDVSVLIVDTWRFVFLMQSTRVTTSFPQCPDRDAEWIRFVLEIEESVANPMNTRRVSTCALLGCCVNRVSADLRGEQQQFSCAKCPLNRWEHSWVRGTKSFPKKFLFAPCLFLH